MGTPNDARAISSFAALLAVALEIDVTRLRASSNEMNHRFEFDASMMTSVAGGKSVIDLPRLAVHTEAAATAFIEAYGFRLDQEKDLNQLWYFYRRALVLIEERLGFKIEDMPEPLRDRKNLDDPRKLLLWASSARPEDRDLQRWSCAIMRAVHVFVHAENNLFSSFSEEIQKQILTPFQERIFTDGTSGVTFLKAPERKPEQVSAGEDEIALAGFEIKPFKTSASTVIKLLAKPDAVAMNVLDKLGLRFVTRSVFDTYRVIRFLIEHNLLSFPHIMPDQSTNNLYPAEFFCAVMREIGVERPQLTDEELEGELLRRLEFAGASLPMLRKENSFSGDDYRFIKFIARKLVRVPVGEGKEPFSFFFPYEVQILDALSIERHESGASDHHLYKERQRQAARQRLMPDAEPFTS